MQPADTTRSPSLRTWDTSCASCLHRFTAAQQCYTPDPMHTGGDCANPMETKQRAGKLPVRSGRCGPAAWGRPQRLPHGSPCNEGCASRVHSWLGGASGTDGGLHTHHMEAPAQLKHRQRVPGAVTPLPFTWSGLQPRRASSSLPCAAPNLPPACTAMRCTAVRHGQLPNQAQQLTSHTPSPPPHLRASSTPPRPSAPMAMSTHTGLMRRRAGNRPSIFSHSAVGNVFLQANKNNMRLTAAAWHPSALVAGRSWGGTGQTQSHLLPSMQTVVCAERGGHAPPTCTATAR